MARDHARIQSAIWSDPDFRGLTVPAQHMYFTLLSQPRLSFCGVMDYLPQRLAKLSARATVRSVSATVSSLEQSRFVQTDLDTGELLVRTFVRHDGLLSSPNVTKAMAKDYDAVLSVALQESIEDELGRAYREEPSLAAWNTLAKAYPEFMEKVSRKGSRKGSANG